MPKKKNINLETKVSKYFIARRLKGLPKAKAAREAGISVENTTNYERMPGFQALEEKYKDKLLKHIGLDKVAQEHVKIIEQDRELNAKLNAIKFYTERVEPEVREKSDDDKMIVILKS
jgi:hypothetical protein